MAVLYVLVAVVTSSLLTFTIGTAYLDNRIQKNLESSRVIDARVDSAFQGLCGLLLISARPRPKPPVPAQLPTDSAYVKALAEYNRSLAKQQAEGLAALNAALDTYHCRR
jgi:hypothetical protein